MKARQKKYYKNFLIALATIAIVFFGYRQFAIWDARDVKDDHSVVNDLLLPLTPMVSVEQAHVGLSRSDVQIVDVRSPEEYDAGHINGAIPIPEETLYKVIPKTFKNKAQIIYLYCNTGHQGAVSTRLLRVMGYANAFSIKGGLDAWESAGYVVDK